MRVYLLRRHGARRHPGVSSPLFTTNSFPPSSLLSLSSSVHRGTLVHTSPPLCLSVLLFSVAATLLRYPFICFASFSEDAHPSLSRKSLSHLCKQAFVFVVCQGFFSMIMEDASARGIAGPSAPPTLPAGRPGHPLPCPPPLHRCQGRTTSGGDRARHPRHGVGQSDGSLLMSAARSWVGWRRSAPRL